MTEWEVRMRAPKGALDDWKEKEHGTLLLESY